MMVIVRVEDLSPFQQTSEFQQTSDFVDSMPLETDISPSCSMQFASLKSAEQDKK